MSSSSATDNTNSYTFPRNLDASVPEFFSINPICNWDLDKFSAYCRSKQFEISDCDTIECYRQSFLKIIKNEAVPITIKSKAGQVMATNIGKGKKKEVPLVQHATNGFNNSGTVVGDVYVNCDIKGGEEEKASVAQKRRKVNHLEEKCWVIDDEEDFWDAWRQYLEVCVDHQFCLETYHIIQCGYSIRCHPEIPAELYEHLETNSQTISSPFISRNAYTLQVLTAFRDVSDYEDIENVIRGIADASEEYKFCKNFFRKSLGFFESGDFHAKLSINEASFNHSLVWPVIEMAINSVGGGVSFAPGEYKLESSSEEYKADAVALFDGMEIALLETSGKLLLGDLAKYGYDHVKGVFGCLSLFNNALNTFYYANESTAMKLKTSFIHARGDELHLWSLELCSQKLYVLKKIFKFTIPSSQHDISNILAMGSFIWELKCQLARTASTIEEMKVEHKAYELQKMMGGAERRESLKKLIDVGMKRPVKGADFGILLPIEKIGDEVDVRFVPPR